MSMKVEKRNIWDTIEEFVARIERISVRIAALALLLLVLLAILLYGVFELVSFTIHLITALLHSLNI